jgi:uncharacterized protein YwgA
MVEMDNWSTHGVMHKDKIRSFSFLSMHGYIREVADGYYCLTEDPETVETQLWKDVNGRLANELNIADIEKEIRTFIAKLNEYNEIKDIAQELMGKIAEFKQTTTRVIHEELGIDCYGQEEETGHHRLE